MCRHQLGQIDRVIQVGNLEFPEDSAGHGVFIVYLKKHPTFCTQKADMERLSLKALL